ncbi:MAG: DUF4337 family protein [Rhodoblastus sp.]|nr:MAG: DUF4337 family protein [Rhodoblastus sp.]
MEIETPENDRADRQLTNTVAITVVAISVFLALQGVKSGNVAQALESTKADIVDKWNQYQAARLKHDLVEAALSTNRLIAATPGVDPSVVATERQRAEKAIAAYVEREKSYQEQAKALEDKLEGLNKRDDQFDVAEAMCSLALALAAIAILAESWWLVGLSWIFGAFGVTMGGAAMAGVTIYPQWLVDILT